MRTVESSKRDIISMNTNILVVDDDPQVRRLCRLTLEDPGFLVAEASNGKEALAAIKKMPFGLVVLDLCMPDMDGIEFLMTLRAELPKHKIIVMSGFMQGAMLRAAQHLGGAAALAKPFSPDSLLSLVDEVLAANSPVSSPV